MRNNVSLAELLLQDIKFTPQINDFGIWTIDGRIGLGFVLLLESPAQEILVIRKAAREGYEFSGKLVLPGGMVRVHGDKDRTDFVKDLELSVADRINKEVGICPGSISGLCSTALPVVTSYLAKGAQRYTLVWPLKGSVPDNTLVESRTASVQDPKWVNWKDLLLLLNEAAPANRLVIASYLWERMTPGQQGMLAATVAGASSACGSWALEIGLSAFASPWPFRDA